MRTISDATQSLLSEDEQLSHKMSRKTSFFSSLSKYSLFRRTPPQQITPIALESLVLPDAPPLFRHRSESQQMVMDTGILGHTFQMLQIPELCSIRRVNMKWYTISKQVHVMTTQMFVPNNLTLIPHSSIEYVRGLDCCQCYSITDTILSSHVTSLHLLTHLKLNGQWSSITDQGLHYLASLPSLTHLELDTCVQMSEQGMYHVANIKTLQVLSITTNMQQWGDHTLRYLTNVARTLRSLTLRSTQFNTRLSCSYLASLASLSYLEFQRFDLTQADMQSIGQIKSLHTLHISHNYTLLDRYMIHLNDMPLLRVLKLQNTVGLTDSMFFYLTPAILNQLTSLHIMECRITDNAVQQLHAAGMSSLEVLEIAFCGGISDQCTTFIKFPKLHTLSVRGCQQITGSTLSELVDVPLHTLDISCTNVRDAGIQCLMMLTGITSLSIAHLRISNGSLFRLRNLELLHHLDLSGCELITPRGLSYLLALYQLDSLILHECRQLNREKYTSILRNASHMLYQTLPRTMVLQSENLLEYDEIMDADRVSSLECCDPCQTTQSCVIC